MEKVCLSSLPFRVRCTLHAEVWPNLSFDPLSWVCLLRQVSECANKKSGDVWEIKYITLTLYTKISHTVWVNFNDISSCPPSYAIFLKIDLICLVFVFVITLKRNDGIGSDRSPLQTNKDTHSYLTYDVSSNQDFSSWIRSVGRKIPSWWYTIKGKWQCQYRLTRGQIISVGTLTRLTSQESWLK